MSTPSTYSRLDSPANGSSSSSQQHREKSINGDAMDGDALLRPQTSSLSPDLPADEFRVYPVRWLVLFIFALSTITNAVLWIAFAPIIDEAVGQFETLALHIACKRRITRMLI